jgi:hypothetical protein
VHLAGDDLEGLAVEGELSVGNCEGVAGSWLSLNRYGQTNNKKKGEKSLTQIIYSKGRWGGNRALSLISYT